MEDSGNFRKIDEDVLLLEEALARIDKSLTSNGDQINNELLEICKTVGNTEEQRLFERLNDLESEETELQNNYYKQFDEYSKKRREWTKRIISSLREVTDGPLLNDTSQQFAQSVFLKKLLDNPPISIVKENIQNFGPFDLKLSEIHLSNRPLGAGGYGEVYEGHCRGVLVAVKSLRVALKPDVIQNFLRECAILKNSAHTNILLFMGACHQANKLYLVTELAPRGSLDRYLHQEDKEEEECDSTVFTKLNFFQKMNICREVARGMNWLHKQNILHLDLKPANLLLMEDWTVKIADFGLSRLKPDKDQIPTDHNLSTLCYMAPEAFEETSHISEKWDVYAYSIVLWEVATERHPYDNKYCKFHHFSRVRDLQSPERPLMDESTSSKITKSLAALIEQCWHKDPSKRPSFQHILPPHQDGDIFQTIFAEYVTVAGRDNLGEKMTEMWKSFGYEANAVPWDKFERAFIKLMNTKPKDPNMSSLKALLNVEGNDYKVTSSNFNHFVKTFGPLEPVGGAKMSTLDAVSQIVKEKWFWGELNSNAAAALLKKHGSYLVRFSEGHKGAFTLSYRLQNQVFNKRLNCTPLSLKGKVKEEKKQLKLKKTPPGRPAQLVNAANCVNFSNHVGGKYLKTE